jgi:hypothetical protein
VIGVIALISAKFNTTVAVFVGFVAGVSLLMQPFLVLLVTCRCGEWIIESAYNKSFWAWDRALFVDGPLRCSKCGARLDT